MKKKRPSGGARDKAKREREEAHIFGHSIDELIQTRRGADENPITVAEAKEAAKIIAKVMKFLGPAPIDSQAGIEWGSRFAMLATQAAYSTQNLRLWKWADHVTAAVAKLGMTSVKWKYESNIMRLLAEYDRARDARTPIKREIGIKRPPTSRGGTPRGPRPVE